MSYDQVAIYKYGSQAQSGPANDTLVVARRFVPKSRTPQPYRPTTCDPSIMSGRYESNGAQGNSEQNRQYLLWKQQKERAEALGHILGGVARTPEHEEWEMQQEHLRTHGGNQSSYQEAFKTQNSGDIQYKSAQIHDPTNNQLNEVEIIEDSACRVNFISPRVAKLCNLTVYSTSPIQNATLMGSFTSNQWTEITWFGQKNNNGSDWFYLAPEGARIDLLVGTEFLRDHPDAFPNRPLLEPALLNVQTRLKEDEQLKIQANEALALRQAAELENRRKQTKQQPGQQKRKQIGGSSRSSRHKNP